jgi:DNA-binding Lrp family transcriptional regulator
VLPTARQDQILQWLADQQTLTIEELTARLGVSAMTVHRDLDALVQAGQVSKIHGGVTLGQRAAPQAHPTTQTCALCHVAVHDRSAFIIQVQDADPITACCPHCGFHILVDVPAVVSVLVKDFLYGRTLNAVQAHYLVDSAVHTCCVPGILSFATRADAERFHKGFDGFLTDFAGLRTHLASAHHSHTHQH